MRILFLTLIMSFLSNSAFGAKESMATDALISTEGSGTSSFESYKAMYPEVWQILGYRPKKFDHSWIVYSLQKPGNSKKIFLTGTIHNTAPKKYLRYLFDLMKKENIKMFIQEYKKLCPVSKEHDHRRRAGWWGLEDEIAVKLFEANNYMEKYTQYIEKFREKAFDRIKSIKKSDDNISTNESQVQYLNSIQRKKDCEQILYEILSSTKIRIDGVSVEKTIPEPALAETYFIPMSHLSQQKQSDQKNIDYIGEAFEHLSLPLVMGICNQMSSLKPKEFHQHHSGVRNQQLAELINQNYDNHEFDGNILSGFGCAHVFSGSQITGFPTVLDLLIKNYGMEVIEKIKIPGSCPPWFDEVKGEIKTTQVDDSAKFAIGDTLKTSFGEGAKFDKFRGLTVKIVSFHPSEKKPYRVKVCSEGKLKDRFMNLKEKNLIKVL